MRAKACEAELDAAEASTQVRPATCPWSGFYDPDVRLVRWVHGFWPHLEHAWGDEPEQWLVEAVAFYHRALEQAARVAREKPDGAPMGGAPRVEEKPGGGVKIRG